MLLRKREVKDDNKARASFQKLYNRSGGILFFFFLWFGIRNPLAYNDRDTINGNYEGKEENAYSKNL